MQLNPLKIILFTILFTVNAFSQKYELGEVTIEELKEKVHPKDSSAVAAVLFKKGETRFNLDPEGNWTITTEIKYKIKIYKKEGLDYANKIVTYYVGGFRNEALNFKNEVTYNLVDGKVEKTKLKSDGEFKEDLTEDFKSKKITMPQVKEGSIVEYSYTLKSPYINTFNDWYFQGNIPYNHVEYDVYLPKYFKYRTVITGYEKVNMENKSITTGNFSEQKYTYTIDNVPALKEEGNIINIDNYTAILKYELASIEYPNQPVKNIAITWDDVVKSIYESEYFGAELKNKSYFEEDLKAILEGLKTNNEKIEAIFNFVKNRMTWNEKYGVYTNDGVRKAYKQKTGNVSEINLILTAMLKYAGIEANPVLLSTRKNGIAMFPNRTAFNYVVAGIEVQDNVLLLDATNKNAIINLLPLRAVNWNGRIIRERGSSNVIDLLNVPSSKDNIIVLGEIKDSGKIEGKLRRQLTDYNAYIQRDNYASLSEDSYIERIENRYKGLSIEEYKAENMKDLYKPVVESYSFSHNNSIEVIGDKMYVSPLLFFTEDENPFKLEDRKYPVDFNFPYKDTYNITIKIPDGYEVEFLPTPISLAIENNEATFKYNISSANNNIQLMVNFDINTFYIPAEGYLALKGFYKMLIEKQREKVILKKKG